MNVFLSIADRVSFKHRIAPIPCLRMLLWKNIRRLTRDISDEVWDECFFVHGKESSV